MVNYLLFLILMDTVSTTILIKVITINSTTKLQTYPNSK
ncbi:Hypothetical protein SSCIU_00476 [Mammaliicoccus sciuri]|nr:Hypothetical protein SSCIU_00476 [Mammaliicoccus sciuri]